MPDSYRQLCAADAVLARRKILEACRMLNPSQVARQFHLSRTTIYKILARYQREGEAGLTDRSRRPKHIARQTPAEIENLVVRERQRTGFGPLRMHRHLVRNAKVTISPSTLRNIFRRYGLAVKRNPPPAPPVQG